MRLIVLCTFFAGYEWFPRMDVVESGSAFVVTVELPGVSADGICCEVTSDRWKLFFPSV